MPSKPIAYDDDDVDGRSIAERAAEAARNVARRRYALRSQLLRAREMASFALGRERTDVRGWQVYSNDAELVGTVSSLFIDIRTRAVRYLGIVPGDSHAKSARGEVLIPVGSASRPDDRELVILTTLSRRQLLAAPRVPNRPVTRADEYATLKTCGMQLGSAAAGDDLYGSPLFEEWRLFGGERSRAVLP
jgi:sporulation protein YlmC with PRC-barrel domain